MMMRHLSGWQRLWVFLSTIWLVIVGFFAFTMMPKASDYATTRLYGTMNAVGKYLEKENPDVHYVGPWTTRTKYYSDLTDNEILGKLHSKYKDTVDFTSVEREYRYKMDGLRTEQLKAVGLSFLVWIIPSLLVYILGYGVAWIVKGFQQPTEKE